MTSHPWLSYREDIQTAVIGHGVTSIGGYAFSSCTSLESIEISASVTSIGECAFQKCTSLENIEIPASVTSIDKFAFTYCTSLESIEIPASVTSIGSDIISYCASLESISVAAGNTVYDSRNNCNALIETANNTLMQGCKNSVIPDGVTSIGVAAFYDCKGLTSIEIPSSVTTIGHGAFSGCDNVTSVSIGNGVTTIGDGAFSGCTSLSSVTIYAPSLTTYGEYAFQANAEGRKIYVFKNCMDTYKAQAEDMGDVTLKGRTLYKDGAWNTLCLPFDVSTTSGPLSGDNVQAMVLRADSGISGTTLTLNFDNAPATITAGTPFIVKWDNTDEKITDPVFTGVTIDDTNRDVPFTGGSFKGTYAPIAFDSEDFSVLFLGTNNRLYFPKSGAKINPFRAYFHLENGADVREFKLNFGDNNATGIVDVRGKMEDGRSEEWYTLDGRKLSTKPTKKGMYINNGRKVIVK